GVDPAHKGDRADLRTGAIGLAVAGTGRRIGTVTALGGLTDAVSAVWTAGAVQRARALAGAKIAAIALLGRLVLGSVTTERVARAVRLARGALARGGIGAVALLGAGGDAVAATARRAVVVAAVAVGSVAVVALPARLVHRAVAAERGARAVGLAEPW